MKTVIGQVADDIGTATKTVVVQGANRPEIRRETWDTPAHEFRAFQRPRIPVDLEHDRLAECGEVIHLERGANGLGLWAVAHVDDDIDPSVPVYWSGTTFGSRDIELRALSIVTQSARICPRPIKVFAGALDYPSSYRRWSNLTSYEEGLLKRAESAHLNRRRHPGPLIIHDTRAPGLERRGSLTPERVAQALDENQWEAPPRRGPLEYSTPLRNAIISVR